MCKPRRITAHRKLSVWPYEHLDRSILRNANGNRDEAPQNAPSWLRLRAPSRVPCATGTARCSRRSDVPPSRVTVGVLGGTCIEDASRKRAVRRPDEDLTIRVARWSADQHTIAIVAQLRSGQSSHVASSPSATFCTATRADDTGSVRSPCFTPNAQSPPPLSGFYKNHEPSCPMIANIGRNIPATMNPTTTPRNTINIGSSAAVKPSTASSTSRS